MAKSSSSVAMPFQAAASTDDVAVADVVVGSGYLQAVSGAAAFAVPAFIPADAAPVPVTGTRRDLGVTGVFIYQHF